MLSKSVADAFVYFDSPETVATKEFVHTFDIFLDTRSLEEAHRKRKPNLAPYMSVDDARLEVCHSFIALHAYMYILVFVVVVWRFLDQWEENVQSKDAGKYDKAEQALMCLSSQTLFGLRMSSRYAHYT